MTFAFGHLIAAWLTGKGYEYFSQKKISHYAWFFLLFGSVMPDADFLLDWTLGTELHRTFSHSLWSLIVLPLLTYLVFSLVRHPEKKNFSLTLGTGILCHLFLDMATSTTGVPLLWPSYLHFSFSGIGYFDPATPSFLEGSIAKMPYFLKLAILDMALGTAWIFYLWWKRRIQF